MKIETFIELFIGLLIVGLSIIVLLQFSVIKKLKNEIEVNQSEINNLHHTIGEFENNESWYEDWIEVIIEIKEQESENEVLKERIKWVEIVSNLENGQYTQEDMRIVVEEMILFSLEVQEDDSVDIFYNENTKIFTITQYNQYGEVFSTKYYTLDEIIDEIL